MPSAVPMKIPSFEIRMIPLIVSQYFCGNYLELFDNKHLPESILSNFHDGIWCHQGPKKLENLKLVPGMPANP